MNEMLTRWEVLMQLRKMEGRSLSQLKRDCREFEDYMAVNYDYEIAKKKVKPQVRNLGSRICWDSL
jgi:hypothetical protein